MTEVDLTAKFTCPRRAEDGTEREDSPFTFAGRYKDEWQVRGDDRPHQCSYCGSVRPDYFLEQLKQGIELGVTDKAYKAYLHISDTGQPPVKFYYQHLSMQQRHEMVAMLNARQVNYGYPGGFTVLPFFIQTGQGRD